MSFLVDAAAYFAAFREAALRAQHSIVMVGWDFDSRIPLTIDGGRRERLGSFLARLVHRRRGLKVHVLGWDYPLVFAHEREFLPLVNFGWRTPRRVHFRLDSSYSFGCSCHQKIVVIDGALAFSGGIDLTNRRWDTPQHLEGDSRRIDPWGLHYPPLHDVMLALDGDAARSLEELVRARWERATGRPIPPAPAGSDPWPPALQPDLRDVTAAIARTVPDRTGQDEVREVERLFLDTIAAARRSLLIENQFLSSASIGDALVRRLAEPDGPEIVLLLSRDAMSLMEDATMGVLRHRLLQKLRAADRYGRLRTYCPIAPGPSRTGVKLHSKVLVADEWMVRVGSANLTNRSMGIDLECDVAIESGGDPRVERGIAAFRARLVAEHLRVDPDALAGAIEEQRLIAAIESFREPERMLDDLEREPPAWLDRVIPDQSLMDPEKPLSAEEVLERFTRNPRRRRWRGGILAALVLLALLVALPWAFEFSPLAAFASPMRLRELIAPHARSPFAVLGVLGGYVLAGLVVPLNALILATVLVFGPALGFAYSLAGSMASAVATFAVGRWLGAPLARRIAGRRLAKITSQVRRQGLFAVVAARLMPIAPYTLVNVVAGACRVRWRSYLGGTLIGLLPGILGFTLLTHQIGRALADPGPGTIAVLVGVVAALGGLSFALRRWARHRRPPSR